MPSEVAQSIYTVRQLMEAVRSQRGAETQEPASNAWSKLLNELPEQQSLFTDLLKPYRTVTLVGFGVLKVANLFARLMVRFQVTGLEHLPQDGPYLICPNHETYIDPFLLASALPYRVFRRLFYVGASEYFATPLLRRAARWMHLAPVDPDANLVRALQAGAFGLRHQKILVLFPEGERSIDGEVRKFKKGAAILSAHLEIPIVPAAFNGVFPIWPRNRGISWRAVLPWSGTRVQLHFGPPMQPASIPEMACSPEREEVLYSSLTEQLRHNVIRLQATLRGKSGRS
jgi:long-chain acyl-CoA synthetase